MKTVLFLCTGNTCRSPMAACLFNHLCHEQGLPMRAISAGLSATEGAPASNGALAAMKSRGLSLRLHQAQPLTPELLKDVSLIVAATPELARRCQVRFPTLTAPIRSFSPPIPDPFWGTLAVYEEAAEAIKPQVSALIAELSQPEA